jgi:UDP-glucose 4-epimerase
MSQVIIFGATGTLGAYTALHLKSIGFDVIATGRRKNDNGFFADHGIKYYSVDIQYPATLIQLPKGGVKSVLHFAAIMPSKMKGYHPQQYIDINVTGTLNVLNYCREIQADRVVYTQSPSDTSHLWGGKEPILPDVEKKFPLKGDHAIYAISKNAAFDLVEHYYFEYGIKRFILRLPATIYAFRPSPHYYVDGEKQMMAYRYLMERAQNGAPIEIWGDPKREKEIVYVKDFTQAIEKSLNAQVDGGIYNVGTGVGVTLEEQILGIINVFSPKDKKSEVIYKRDKADVKQYIYDISKTTRELGYVPKYNYMELLMDFKDEMLKNRFGKLWE